MSTFGMTLAAVLLAALAVSAVGQDSLADRLKQPILASETAHRELRVFLGARVPAAEAPADAAAWNAAARGLRKRFLDEVVYRGVPRAWITGRPRVEWTETIATKHGYRIRKLRYEAVPGLWIPALLYEPDGPTAGARLPAVLNVNGHVGTPGKAIAYEQIRCINLARRGMLALHPEWLNCGELSGPEYRHNRLAYLDLCGRSGLSVFYLAMRRGLDLLETHPRADRRRLAVTGLSGGGWQTIWLSALETRVAATAPNAGYIGQGTRLYHRGDIGDLEQNPTDLLRVGDYTHLTALLAPRPALLIYNEKDDCCFQTARARPSVFEPIVPFYRLFRREAAFRFHNNTDPGTHNYERDNREQFYRFLNAEFRPDGEPRDAEIEVNGEVLSFDALRVGVPAGNADFGRLAEELLPSLPRSRWPAEGPEGESAEKRRRAAERWQAESRRRLASLLRFRPQGAATAGTAREAERTPDGLTLVRRTLRAGGAWTLPAVEVRPENPRGTALVVTQEGRAAAAEMARALTGRGLRAVVVDLALCGEASPPSVPRFQHAMMIGAAGERLLGIQAAQLLAAAEWARREFGTESVTLAGAGRVGSVIAAAAAALAADPAVELPVEALVAEGLPASLKLLIEERREYEECPELFCFGLLEQFDTRELLGMSGARRITLRAPLGDRERAERELGSVAAFRTRLGGAVEWSR